MTVPADVLEKLQAQADKTPKYAALIRKIKKLAESGLEPDSVELMERVYALGQDKTFERFHSLIEQTPEFRELVDLTACMILSDTWETFVAEKRAAK